MVEHSAEKLVMLAGQRFDDTEQAIAALESGLRTEGRLRAWPVAAADRREVRARLLLRIGETYCDRRHGSRADNLEKALSACADALDSLPKDSFPALWAHIHHTLGRVYFSRIQGDIADNLERALAHHQAALTVRTRDNFPIDWAKTQNNHAVVYRHRIRGKRADNLEQALAACEAALTVRRRDEFPTDWAVTQDNLANAYADRICGGQADNLERAITAYEAALTVDTREASPNEWAMTHHNLASAYRRRIRGERSDNLERTITHYEAALTVLTPEAYPIDWARTQNNLAIIFAERIRGERADNLERAIAQYGAALTVYTREAFPTEWAATQNNLANAYVDRIRADRAGNFECAIAHYEAALTVHTREAFPIDWARTQNNFAIAFARRIRGERAENLERGIAHCHAALAVYMREVYPVDWAMTQNNLAIAYANRICGERADNLERAIAAYEAALSIYTRDAFPIDWAMSQNNLAIAYANRIRGERADNLERAIAHHEAALTTFLRESHPADWAMTQNNLAIAYADRIRGERADNIERAIAAYEAALTVYTREAFPQDWAMTQNNLASSYRRRFRGERADNLERAIGLYEAALTVHSREAFPNDWARTQSNLAIAYADRLLGEHANNLECAITGHEAALTVYTRAAFPTDWAATQSNLAVVYADRLRGERANNLECAIGHYEAALAMYTRETFPEHWAMTQNNLAGVLAVRIHGDQRDNLQRAIALYQAVLKIHTREAFPRGHLETTQSLGQALLAQSTWCKAAQTLAEARKTFLLLFGQGLDEAEARGLIEIAGPLFANAAYAACALGDPTQAFRLVSEGKTRLLATALRQQTLDLPPESRRRLDVLRTEIRVRSRALERVKGLERAAVLDRLNELRAELAAIITSAESTAGETDAITQASALVSEGGALIAPIVTETGGKLLLVTGGLDEALPVVTAIDLPGLTTHRVRMLMRGNIEEGSSGWLAAFARDLPWHERKLRATCAIEEMESELWRLLTEPIERALGTLGVAPGARLIFLPSGPLGLLPLGLAREPSSGRRLLETYDIVTAPSLFALTEPPCQAEMRAAFSLAAVINPSGDLVYAPIEGALVAAHFEPESRTLLDELTAAPETVLAALKGKTHWHFSTHGTFNREEPRRSALAMKGGATLSVGSLLEADDLGRPRLVVLSACETGLHDIVRTPEEFIGLPGAFMAIGARAVLGTLWPVDDRATAMLTARFYDLHLSERFAPATALRKAQLWLKSATREDLVQYAHAAEARGHLRAHQTRQLERAFGAASAGAASFFGAAKAEMAEGSDWACGPSARDGPGRDRPFAHPVYWGGFIITGL